MSETLSLPRRRADASTSCRGSLTLFSQTTSKVPSSRSSSKTTRTGTVPSSSLTSLVRRVRLRQWWIQIWFVISEWIRNCLWKGTARGGGQFQQYPLPPGSFRCPLRQCGLDVRQATTVDGPGTLFKRRAASLQYPTIWKGLTKTEKNPFVVLSGASIVKQVLKQEFTGSLISNAAIIPFSSGIVGMHSLRFARNKQEHAFLRRLVGAALSPQDAVLVLQQTAQDQVHQMLLLLLDTSSNNGGTTSSITPVRLEEMCHQYTLHVAWRQILGLTLDEQEIPIFLEMVQVWMTGLFDSTALNQSMVARQYLVSLIQDRMDELERDGPDGSTLGNMVFATDDDDVDDQFRNYAKSPRKLSRDQVIDNALLLILAGSDTSAGTLAASLFSMGHNPHVWQGVVDEQQALLRRRGTDLLDKEQLDRDCPYLDAVVKETMRLFPIIGGSARATKRMIIIDGTYQVPKNWAVLYDRWLTHRQDPITYCNDGSHMDPLQGFQPERWLNDTTRPTSEYIPFGAGPRYCLGADLSLAEVKTFLAVFARMIKKYELVLPANNSAEIKWKTQSLFQLPADGVEAIVQPVG